MSAIFLAKELGASPVLLDDYRARKLAKAERLEILGSVGLLETFTCVGIWPTFEAPFGNSWSTTFISISDCWIVVCGPWDFLRFKVA